MKGIHNLHVICTYKSEKNLCSYIDTSYAKHYYNLYACEFVYNQSVYHLFIKKSYIIYNVIQKYCLYKFEIYKSI